MAPSFREPVARCGAFAAGVAVTCVIFGFGDAQGQIGSPVPSSHHVSVNQLAIDGGWGAAFGLSYARRLATRPLLIGGRLGYAFEENGNTFDPNIWEVLGIDGFVRLVPNDALHGELGISVLGFSPEDDTNVRGTFLGLFTAVMVGYRYVFVGSEFRLGVAGLEGQSEAGVIVSPRIRVVIPWGR